MFRCQMKQIVDSMPANVRLYRSLVLKWHIAQLQLGGDYAESPMLYQNSKVHPVEGRWTTKAPTVITEVPGGMTEVLVVISRSFVAGRCEILG